MAPFCRSILLLYQATSSPSKTLFTGCCCRHNSRETAVSQPDGCPSAGGCPLPAWQRPSGKVTCSLVIPAGKNSRGRGAGACAWGGTGRATEPPKLKGQSRTPLLGEKKKAENPLLTQFLSWDRIHHPSGTEM